VTVPGSTERTPLRPRDHFPSHPFTNSDHHRHHHNHYHADTLASGPCCEWTIKLKALRTRHYLLSNMESHINNDNNASPPFHNQGRCFNRNPSSFRTFTHRISSSRRTENCSLQLFTSSSNRWRMLTKDRRYGSGTAPR
jgi:hypothetical protein